MPIQPLEKLLNETLVSLGNYQEGRISQIKTNRPWLDHQNGITPKSFITIFGASFGGKSTELENLKSDIMNTDINPEANDYVWVSNSFEMTNFATTMRDIKKLTKLSFGDILKKPFTAEEKVILKDYKLKKTDGRFFVNQTPLSTEEFLKETEQFLLQHIDKKLVVLDLDHVALLKAKNDNKKIAIDDMVEGLNTLKNRFENFLVILLTQANRSVLGRIKEKSNESRLRRDDIYMSDCLYHISDYVYGLQNANYLGIEEYALINPEKYPHLSHRFTDENKHGKVSLITEGCIFVEVLKDRTSDIGFTDLFTIEVKPFNKKSIYKPLSFIPTFGNQKLTPIADLPPPNIFDLNIAFPKKSEDSPF
jgi:hypothetical protein